MSCHLSIWILSNLKGCSIREEGGMPDEPATNLLDSTTETHLRLIHLSVGAIEPLHSFNEYVHKVFTNKNAKIDIVMLIYCAITSREVTQSRFKNIKV